MGMEEGCGYYDNFYKTRTYNQIEKEPWYSLWETVFSELDKNESIADFGCGSGQLANLILRNNMKYVIGIDFSKEAIIKAKEININYKELFIVGDLYDSSIYTKYIYDVAVFCEVLEHLNEDLKILSYIPKGKRVILSLPGLDCRGHVRYFKDSKNSKPLEERYGNTVDIKKIYNCGWWIIDSIKK